MTRRLIAAAAVLALSGSLLACGDDGGTSSADLDAAGAQTAAGGDVAAPSSDAGPADWYAPLDDLDAVEPGAGTLVIGGETIALEVSSCSFSLDNVSFDGVPEQSDDVSFQLAMWASGPVGDSEQVSIYAFRQVFPAGGQTDSVQLNLGSSPEASEAADEADRTQTGETLPIASRHLVRGATGDPELPLLKIDPAGPAMTAVGEAEIPFGADPDGDPAITGPYELSAACP